MARARNIKPGFFLNEDLVELSFETRLLFIGLWTLADRRGRLQDRPKKIKMSIFPADNLDIDGMLRELHGAGMVQRYEASGIQYIQILNFEKHQNPHKNEADSVIPKPEQDGKSTMQAPEQHGATHADSLIPDSGFSDSGQDTTANAVESPPSDDPPADSQTNGKTPPCPAEKIRDAYHAALPQLPHVLNLTDKRRKWLQSRWREDVRHQSLEFWVEYFGHVATSEFLLGDNDRQWKADFEWLVNKSNFYKTIEGKYHHGS